MPSAMAGRAFVLAGKSYRRRYAQRHDRQSICVRGQELSQALCPAPWQAEPLHSRARVIAGAMPSAMAGRAFVFAGKSYRMAMLSAMTGRTFVFAGKSYSRRYAQRHDRQSLCVCGQELSHALCPAPWKAEPLYSRARVTSGAMPSAMTGRAFMYAGKIP